MGYPQESLENTINTYKYHGYTVRGAPYLDGPMEVIVTIVCKLGYFTYLKGLIYNLLI